MPKVFEYDIDVTGDGLDDNQHVNNIQYLHWMQSAAIAHAEAQGSRPGMKAAEAIWVVRSHFIEYLSPAFAGDKICIRTWVANFDRLSSLRKYRLIRESNQDLIVRAETKWVCVDLVSGRPRRIPSVVRDAFDVVSADEEPTVM